MDLKSYYFYSNFAAWTGEQHGSSIAVTKISLQLPYEAEKTPSKLLPTNDIIDNLHAGRIA